MLAEITKKLPKDLYSWVLTEVLLTMTTIENILNTPQ